MIRPFLIPPPSYATGRRGSQASPAHLFFKRGRDTAAGYNDLMIALIAPASLLREGAVASIGLSDSAQRKSMTFRTRAAL